MSEQNAQAMLARIAEIIEHVDQRAMACDGPVTPTLKEMTQAEISEIYAIAERGKLLSPPVLTVSATAALEFYANEWRFKTKRNIAGLEWRPSDALLDDCGNKAKDALAAPRSPAPHAEVREVDALKRHLDAAYEAAGLSQTSSKPLADHIHELRSNEAREKEITRLATIEECADIADIHAFSARQAVRSATGPKLRQRALAVEDAALQIVKSIRALAPHSLERGEVG